MWCARFHNMQCLVKWRRMGIISGHISAYIYTRSHHIPPSASASLYNGRFLPLHKGSSVELAGLPDKVPLAGVGVRVVVALLALPAKHGPLLPLPLHRAHLAVVSCHRGLARSRRLPGSQHGARSRRVPWAWAPLRRRSLRGVVIIQRLVCASLTVHVQKTTVIKAYMAMAKLVQEQVSPVLERFVTVAAEIHVKGGRRAHPIP
mmetsp:Transcript_37015/g.66242  ORF Transcript_37015/g.66242 Transcript_37015/m.66242 type:complete len:204 (+) Transcript_37015:3-614(+)